MTRPMRCMLFSCLIKEMLARISTLSNPEQEQRRTTLKKLGWMQDEHFLTIRWDAQQKKLVGDPNGPKLSIAEASETLGTLGTHCQSAEGLCRFHPTRPISEGMPEGTVCFLLQFNLMDEAGRQMYAAMERLCSSGSTQLAGMEIRKERMNRSAAAQQLAQVNLRT